MWVYSVRSGPTEISPIVLRKGGSLLDGLVLGYLRLDRGKCCSDGRRPPAGSISDGQFGIIPDRVLSPTNLKWIVVEWQ